MLLHNVLYAITQTERTKDTRDETMDQAIQMHRQGEIFPTIV